MAEGNILVIEDELVMCDLLSDLLKDRGYDVNCAQSGEEGLKLLERTKPDVVISDLKMPGMDGITVLRTIKQRDPDSVVIIITAFGSLETAQEALRIGAYDYITKPFEINKIAFIVRRAVLARKLLIANKELMANLEKQNLELEKKIYERTKEVSLLFKIGQELTSTLELDEVLRGLVNKLGEVIKYDICAILLFDKTKVGQELYIKYSVGLDEECIKANHLKKGEKISGWVIENNESIISGDVNEDPRFKGRMREIFYKNSFISVPLASKNEVIGAINICNSTSKNSFKDDDLRFVQGIAAEAAIAIDNARLYERLQEVVKQTMKTLVTALDAKDHYTYSHSEDVANYAVAIAKQMGLSPEQIEIIREACELHDLGKIGVHDAILTKPDKLTEEEWKEMKQHSVTGAEILAPLEFMEDVGAIVRQIHERYDGEGYPDKLKGDQISLGARIITVADSFDTMISNRPYHKPKSVEEAMKELEANRGKQFDPNVVDAFLEVARNNPGIIKRSPA